LHDETPLHDVEHENVSQAMPVGQSPAVKQPQAPAPHAPELQQKSEPQVPSVLPPHVLAHTPLEHVGVPSPHVWQAPPVVPHAPLSEPDWQTTPSQQPPWQASPPEHDDVHTCAELHALPTGQSVVESLHPQVVPTQALPSEDAVQSAQSPATPQLVDVPRQSLGTFESSADASTPPPSEAP